MSLDISCHCKAFQHRIHIPDEDIPQEDTFCCCNSCRRRTGTLGICPISSAVNGYEVVRGSSSLKCYQSTNESTGNNVNSFFCTTCGAQIFICITEHDGKFVGGGWMLGGFDRIIVDDKLLIKPIGFSYSDDTIDGGIGAFWKTANGQQLETFQGNVDAWRPNAVKDSDEYLHIHCRCDGIELYVSRPSANENDGQGKYRGLWCACDSCRTTTGSNLPAFAFATIPFRNIHRSQSSSSSILKDAGTDKWTAKTDIPGCTRYHSTGGNDSISRYFCSGCGAAVMYYSDEDEAGDWAVGLMDSKEGVIAPSWIKWKHGVDFKEDGEKRWGKGIMDDFENGLVDWCKRIQA